MGLFRKFFTVGGATLASRFLGFAREMLIALLLGAGPVADAFYAAFRFPNLFRRLFAEGVFNAAFVPMFSREMEKGDMAKAKEFAQNVLGLLLFILIVLTAIAEITMPWLVSTIVAPKFLSEPDKFNLTVELTRIMFPYLLCMSVVAMLSGILNTMRRYFLAAIAPVLLNIVLVGALLVSYNRGVDTVLVGKILAWGVLTSGFLQLILLYVGVRRQGFAFSFVLPKPSPKVKKLLWLAAPVALTGGITQVNLLVGQIIASGQSGAIAILNYADRIYQLPLGVVGIAIGVVLLPELSRALASSSSDEARVLQNKSLEFSLFLSVPAAVGLFLLPGPIIAMLYERGAFTADTTLLTAAALAAFAIGLPSFVLQKVFQPVYFARFNMRAPMWFALVSAITNIVGSLLLFPEYGHVGIAVATSIAGWVNALLLIFGVVRNGEFSLEKNSAIQIIKIVIASFVMGICLYALKGIIAAGIYGAGFLLKFGVVLGAVGLCSIIYFAILILLGGLNLSWLRAGFSRNK